ncbi:MAG: hypothetical protein ACRCV0_00445, partial [Brevinema sp.]
MKRPYFNKYPHDIHIETFSLDRNTFEEYDLDSFKYRSSNTSTFEEDVIPVSGEEITNSFHIGKELQSLNQDDFNFKESPSLDNKKLHTSPHLEKISPYQELDKVFSEFDKEVSELLLDKSDFEFSDKTQKAHSIHHQTIPSKYFSGSSTKGMAEFVTSINDDPIQEISNHSDSLNNVQKDPFIDFDHAVEEDKPLIIDESLKNKKTIFSVDSSIFNKDEHNLTNIDKHQTDPAEFEESEDTLQHNTMEAHTLDHEISLDQHKH